MAGTAGRFVGTVLLLAFALRGVKWADLAARFRTTDWRWWLAGLGVGLVVQTVAAVRWGSLARPIGFHLSTATFVRRFFEGAFFSLCLPGSIGGDVVKAYRLSSTNSGRVLAGCTILADRVTGFTALAVVATTALLVQRHGLGTWSAVVVGGVLLLAAMLGFTVVVGTLDRFIGWLPEHSRVKRLLGHLLPYQMRPMLLVQALAWSMIVQMGGSFAVSLVGRAAGVHLPLAIWFGAIPLVTVAMVLPISISGVGVREGGLAVLLAPYGVSAEQAVAIGLLWFLTTIVCGLCGGVFFLADRNPVKIGLPQPVTATVHPAGEA